MLEILELGSSKDVSRIGLQLTFPDALFPFAFIYKDEVILSSINLCLLLNFIFILLSGELNFIS